MIDEQKNKTFLLKTIFLLAALAVVLVVIVVTAMGRTGAEQAGRSRTFFGQFIVAGGPIVWLVLLPMSLVTVYLAVEFGLTIRRRKLLPQGGPDSILEGIREFAPAQSNPQLAGRRDLVSVAIAEAVDKGRGDWFRMRSALAESLQDQAVRLVRKVEWLNLIGNVSPMVGLFGTVFGMIKLFNAIVIAGGQPQPAQLAEGISVALVTTFWGLFIAIPALAMHGVFRNRIETFVSDAVTEAEAVLPQIRRILKKEQIPQNRPEQAQPTSRISDIAPKSKRSIDEAAQSSR